MDSEKCNKTVDYVVFESCQARNERHVKRLIVIIGILIGLLFITNALWLWVFSGFDMETYEYEQGDSGINIIGDDNKEVTYNGTKAESAEIDQTDRRTG